MAARCHLTLGAASLAAWLAGAASVAGQVKRPWIDPPADLGAGSPAKPVEKPEPMPQQQTSAADQAAAKSAASSEKPANAVAAPAPDAATASTSRIGAAAAPPRAAAAPRRTRVRPVARARPSTVVKAGPAVQAHRHHMAAKPARRGARIPVAGRPLEIMNLTTIELEDGRRIKVLTRPDPQTVESLLLGQ